MRVISLNFLRERIKNTHPRTKKAHLNTALGLFVKGGGMVISLLLVPLTIDYLSKDIYGTWLTISSIVSMLTLLDIGIGNGLRNKFSEAVANKDTTLARAYVSTAYAIFGAVQLFLVCLFLGILRFVPWQGVFNTHIDTTQLQVVVLLTVIAMAIKLVLDILSYILFALQESSRVGLIAFLSNALILIGTYTLTHFTNGNLIYLATVSAASPILVLLISGFVLYRDKLKLYRPTFRLINLNYVEGLLSLGYKFFVIQIAVVVLFYTDNLIITQLFGPPEVTVYNIAFRYFNAATTLFSIGVTPYWSAFTEASVKNDTVWMQRTYSYLQKVWLAFFCIVIFMIIVAEPIYSIWIGDRAKVPMLLSFVMGISVIITCWNNVNVSVINGLGKIKLQLLLSLFVTLINIPLAVYLARELGFGVSGVMLSTCLSLLPATVLGTIQAKKLINNTARGIWAN